MATTDKKNFAVETTLEEYERGMNLLDKCDGVTKKEKLKNAFDIIERAMRSEGDDTTYQSHIAAIRDSVDNIVTTVHAIVLTSQEAVKQADAKNVDTIESLNTRLKDAEARNVELERKFSQECAARSEVETERNKKLAEIDFLRATNLNNADLIMLQRDEIGRLKDEISHLKSQIACLQEPGIV